MVRSAEPQRILLVRRKAIGDIVVSLATAHALRRRWPLARLEIVVDRMAENLLSSCPIFDEVLVYSPASGARRPFRDLAWALKLRGRHYDLVLDLMGTPLTAWWSYLSGGRVRIGKQRRLRSWAYNVLLPRGGDPPRFAGEELLDFARAAGAEVERWEPVPILGAGDGTPPTNPLEGDGPWVILHAPATWSAKAWPVQHWGRLVKLLHEKGVERIEVSWGPGEEKVRDALVQASDGLAVAMPRVDLQELARRLRGCDLLVAVESGPVHLAVAEGTPTLTLFGSTDPRGWHAPLAGHRVLFHEVGCRPCNLTKCPVEGHPCLDLLEPEEVCKVAIAMLEESKEVNA